LGGHLCLWLTPESGENPDLSIYVTLCYCYSLECLCPRQESQFWALLFNVLMAQYWIPNIAQNGTLSIRKSPTQESHFSICIKTVEQALKWLKTIEFVTKIFWFFGGLLGYFSRFEIYDLWVCSKYWEKIIWRPSKLTKLNQLQFSTFLSQSFGYSCRFSRIVENFIEEILKYSVRLFKVTWNKPNITCIICRRR
jgi:hypothetical protein